MIAEQFFESVARNVFGETLQKLGATEILSTPLSLRFESSDWFVVLFALAEDGPRYCPRVAIGPLPMRGVLARNTQVDIMHTVPDASPLRNYNLAWRYTDAAEMEQVFSRVRDEVFKPFAQSVLFDPQRLTNLVTGRSAEIHTEWKQEIDAHNDTVYRTKARAASEAKDFGEFLNQMSNIPEERWTDAERARVRYATKQVSK